MQLKKLGQDYNLLQRQEFPSLIFWEWEHKFSSNMPINQ
jgi:hypothetical protein